MNNVRIVYTFLRRVYFFLFSICVGGGVAQQKALSDLTPELHFILFLELLQTRNNSINPKVINLLYLFSQFFVLLLKIKHDIFLYVSGLSPGFVYYKIHFIAVQHMPSICSFVDILSGYVQSCRHFV